MTGTTYEQHRSRTEAALHTFDNFAADTLTTFLEQDDAYYVLQGVCGIEGLSELTRVELGEEFAMPLSDDGVQVAHSPQALGYLRDRLVRRILEKWFKPRIRHSESGCAFGQLRRIEVAINGFLAR